MRVTVTARHTDVSEEVRTRARALIERVAKKAHRPHRADVILDLENGRYIAEFHLHFAKGQIKIGKEESTDFLTALDRAADKLENHLDKKHPDSARRAG